MLAGLGTDLPGSGTLYKRWPCVGTDHSHMKAAIDIVSDHNLGPKDIAEIRLHIGDCHDLMCQPLAERSVPATLADAKFSLPFLVAIAVVRRGVTVTDFTDAGLRDPEILASASKITLASDPALDWKLDLPSGRVEVLAQDGRRWLVEGHHVPGNADAPLIWDDICSKFRKCDAVNVNPLPADRLAKALALAQSLETLPDATDRSRTACNRPSGKRNLCWPRWC